MERTPYKKVILQQVNIYSQTFSDFSKSLHILFLPLQPKELSYWLRVKSYGQLNLFNP